jgi:hypothetical protein
MNRGESIWLLKEGNDTFVYRSVLKILLIFKLAYWKSHWTVEVKSFTSFWHLFELPLWYVCMGSVCVGVDELNQICMCWWCWAQGSLYVLGPLNSTNSLCVDVEPHNLYCYISTLMLLGSKSVCPYTGHLRACHKTWSVRCHKIHEWSYIHFAQSFTSRSTGYEWIYFYIVC